VQVCKHASEKTSHSRERFRLYSFSVLYTINQYWRTYRDRPLIGVLDPQFSETVYISGASGTRKVKSDALVAINKNADPVQKLFLGDG